MENRCYIDDDNILHWMESNPCENKQQTNNCSIAAIESKQL